MTVENPRENSLKPGHLRNKAREQRKCLDFPILGTTNITKELLSLTVRDEYAWKTVTNIKIPWSRTLQARK